MFYQSKTCSIKRVCLITKSCFVCLIIVIPTIDKSSSAPDQSGVISISLSQENGKYLFSYSDNGKGLPENHISRNSKSLGLRLIEMMTRQLDGEMQQQNNSGMTYTLRF